MSNHDHIITYDAVVRHMHISHHQAVLPDNGLSLGARSPVQRGKLPDCGVVAYLQGGLFAAELQVLRYGRD